MAIESQLGSLCRRETGDKQVDQIISGREKGWKKTKQGDGRE